MSTITSTSPHNRNSLLRLSVIGGIIIGLFHGLPLGILLQSNTNIKK